MKAALVGRALFGCDSKNATNGGSDSVGADDQIVLCFSSIRKDDLPTLDIDIAALHVQEE
jgi:hypothetical protein